MIEIRRTEDTSLINRIMGNDEIIKSIREDDYNKEEVEWPINPLIYYLGVFIGSEIIGLFVGAWKSNTVCDCHVAILKEYRKYTDESYKAVIEWVKCNTRFKKLIGQTPVCNPKAVMCNIRNGFEHEGTNKRSYLKDGRYHNQIYFGYDLRD